MRSQYLLLLPLGFGNTHLIARSPTWLEDPTASPPTRTSPAQILQQCAACQVIGSALAICATLTPRFTALQPSAQAKCLCYSSTIWSPNIFDNAVQSCANYASTAALPAYAALSNLENFCGDVGDVEKPVTVFTLSGDGNEDANGGGASTSASNYVASMTGDTNTSPTMTGYGDDGATNTAGSGLSDTGAGNAGSNNPGSSNSGANSSPTTSAGNGGQGSVSPSKTISETGMTTIGGSGSTNTGNSNVARRVIPKNNIVWVGFAISLSFLFL